MKHSFHCAIMTGAVSALCLFTASTASAQNPSVAFARDGWSGFYVGANAGYGWSGNQTFGQTDSLEHGQVFGPAFWKPIIFQGRNSGALGGLQVGYNWQAASHWMAGVEADWSWTGLKPGGVFGPLTEFDGTVVPGAYSTMSTEVRGLGSVRGRLGYTQPNWMAYFTGGLAIAQMKFQGDFFCPPGICVGDDAHAPASFTRTQLGWVLGGGAEFKLSGSPWILGFEYLRYNFSSTNSADAAVILVSNGAPVASGMCAAGERCAHYSFGGVAIDTVRARLIYKFD